MMGISMISKRRVNDSRLVNVLNDFLVTIESKTKTKRGFMIIFPLLQLRKTSIPSET
jgi:hypothetical protein